MGSNVITIEVTAEDGQATKTYTVTVTPAEPPSTDATLKGLTLSGVNFGAFDSAATGYIASVAETTVTQTTNDDGATYAIKLGGVTDDDGVIPLTVGSNVITIEVTAEDGNTAKTYTVTVTRAELPSTDATLSGLALSGVNFGNFDSATTSYDVNVANGVDQTTVTATANDDGATFDIKLGGVSDADGIISLSVGGNVITVEDTAEDGSTVKTYTVTVTRAKAEAGEPPDAPDTPTGEVLEPGRVTLDWNEAKGADSYDVRYFDDDHWVELPTGGIAVVFDGAGAEVSGLPDWGFYYFSVRSVNGAGVSKWSEHNTMNSQD